MRILIIEDEFSLADIISSRLIKEHYTVDISLDGEDGLYKALLNIYDLIILDVMLPYKNGFEILKTLKENNIDSKIIMLTAKNEINDKLLGLTSGALDYLTKPFHIEELVARINIQLRTNPKQNHPDYLEAGDLKLYIYTSKLLCTTTTEEVELICKEFLLLEYFFNNQTQIISKDLIYDKVWGINNDIESNNLEAYISFIRKKLKAIGSTVNIRAVRGLGYKLEINNEKIKK